MKARSNSAVRRNSWATILIVAAMAITLALRILSIHGQPLGNDEWLTLSAISHDVPGLIRDRLAGGHSPFYFLILKALGLGPHSPDALLRLPSAIFDSLAVGLLVWTAARTSGLYGALAMAVFAAFTPDLIGHAEIARPYALLHFFLALAIAGAVATLRAPRVRVARCAVAAMAVGLIGAGYANNIGFLTAILIPASILILPARHDRGFLRLWLVATALVWFALLPNLIALAAVLRKFAGSYWVETVSPFGPASIAELIGNTYAFATHADVDRFIPPTLETALTLTIAGLALVSVLCRHRRSVHRFIAFLALSLPLSLIAASAIQSLLIPRYFVSSLLAYLLLAADGIALVSRAVMGRVATLVLLLVVVLQGVDFMSATHYPDWRNVTGFLDLNSFGVVRGVADSPVDKGMVERNAPPGLDIDLAFEPDPASAKAAVDRLLIREPFVWLFLGWRDQPTELDLESYVACTWRFGQSRIMLVGRDRDSLPAALRTCRPESGSIVATLRRLRPPAAP